MTCWSWIRSPAIGRESIGEFRLENDPAVELTPVRHSFVSITCGRDRQEAALTDLQLAVSLQDAFVLSPVL
jgi:hypothetical protein